MKNLSCEEFDAFESPIDTAYFGINSAIVVLRKACSLVDRQNELLLFLRGFEFATITNKANNSANNLWLGEKTKAFLTDMNMQLIKKVSINEEQADTSITITDNLPENSQIIQIAETCFKFSRFLNDPYLRIEKARAIYGDITKNAFGKIGRFFVILKTAERINGFLLFSMNAPASSATIELVAIDQNYQGRNIGQSLIRAMEHYVGKKGVDTIKVGTQLSNIDALNFYTTMGFRYLECNSIYHYWPFKP